jgi:hypothetical protein
LHSLAYNNRIAIFALLVRSAADTLLALAADPKWLGKDAQLDITTVLHTWTRDLRFHPHVHCIVTGGGLARDKSQWVPALRDFLFPVHVVGALFRGKFMAGLQELLAEGELHDVATDRASRRRQHLYKTSWVVYAKRPFGGPEQVFRYLGRYTHRVAISNARLVSMDDNVIVIRTRGSDTAALSPTEFIGRFLQHILPSRFVKIRHFGIMSSGNVNSSLEQARALLPVAATDFSSAAGDGYDDGEEVAAAGPIDPSLPWPALLLALTGKDHRLSALPAPHHAAPVALTSTCPSASRGCLMTVTSSANASNVGVVRATGLSAAVLPRSRESGLDHRHRVGQPDLPPARSDVVTKVSVSTDYIRRSRTTIA